MNLLPLKDIIPCLILIDRWALIKGSCITHRGSDIFKILARIAFVEVKDPVNEIGFCALDPFNETEIIKF